MSEQKKNSIIDWKYVGRLALVLFLISAVSALLLALTNHVTEAPIATQKEQKEISARQAVLPEADSFEAVTNLEEVAKSACGEDAEIIQEAYAGYKNDQLVGYTVKTAPKGYGGAIEMIVGVSLDRKITAMQIISCEETAGLGAKSTEPEFQDQFSGLNTAQKITYVKGGGAKAENNEIDAITGATITTKAVVRGTNAACQLVQALNQMNNPEGAY